MTCLKQTKGITEFKRIGEVAQINPRAEKSAHPEDLKVSFVPMASVEAETGRIDVSNTRSLGEVKKGYTTFREGDVLFAKITPCMENGKMAVVPKLVNNMGFGSTEFHVLRPRDCIDARYLYHFVANKSFRNRAAHNMTGAVGQKRVLASFIDGSEIPVPPIEKQRSIVAEIKKQFSRLDEAVANLKRVKANLIRYKAAVLKTAVEGRLVPTEAELARKEGRTYETGEQLLARILQERRAAWEKQNGGGHRKKRIEALSPDTSNLPALPEGWVWTNIDQISERVTKGSSPNWQGFNYCESGIVFIRSQNVGWGTVNLSDVAFLPAEFNEKEKKSVLQTGDVLLNIVGASIGRAAIAPKNVAGGNVNQAVAVISVCDLGIRNTYLLLYLLSTDAQRRIHAEKVDVARANFSLEDTRLLQLPLPPLAEQNRIVAEVDHRLSIADNLEAQAHRNLIRANQTRQAILHAAFYALGEY